MADMGTDSSKHVFDPVVRAGTELSLDAAFLRNTVIPILRAGLDRPSGALPENPDDARLPELGFRHAILPILREGLRKLHVGGAGYEAINQACMRDIYLFAQQDTALKQICSCFEEAAVPYVLLKGAALRELYPEPWMRTSIDLDVLVHEDDLETACAALEEKTDLRKLQRNYHDVLFTNDIVHLELHFSIMEANERLDGTLEKVWDYCRPVGSSAQYQMSPEFQILHTVAHMVYHLSKGGLGARHYLDLWLLRSKTAFDEQEVRELCASCGVLKYYEAACDLTAVWLEGQAYTDLTAALEAHCFGGGLFGSEQCIVALGICKNGKAGFLRNRLFPPMHIMAEQYPILRKHSRLLPLYYGKRLCDKLSSRWRRSLKELRLVHKSSGSEVRSLDELLQRLGL